MRFVPKVDAYLTISLPGELLRAQVLKVVSDDSVIVEICSEPLARSHNYKFRDVVICRRKVGMFGEDWEAKPKSNVSMEALARQEEEEIKAMQPKRKAKPIVHEKKRKNK
jgi:hypothetical protein